MIWVCVITTITIQIIPLRIDTKKYRLRHSVFSSILTKITKKINGQSSQRHYVMGICITVMCITMINFYKSPNNPYLSTDYDTQFLHPYLLNIKYGRNGLWTKPTMAEPECGRNVSKAYKCMYMYIYEFR
jgi:hypothetical protein